MADNKDELLRKQQEEILKLKRELKEASKPSSLFTTLKKSFKRNLHEFFNREDKMKSMDAELKELRRKLEETEEEKARQEAIIFAVEHEDAASDTEGCDLPQTPEDALKRFFGPCDIDTYLHSMRRDGDPRPDPQLKPQSEAQTPHQDLRTEPRSDPQPKPQPKFQPKPESATETPLPREKQHTLVADPACPSVAAQPNVPKSTKDQKAQNFHKKELTKTIKSAQNDPQVRDIENDTGTPDFQTSVPPFMKQVPPKAQIPADIQKKSHTGNISSKSGGKLAPGRTKKVVYGERRPLAKATRKGDISSVSAGQTDTMSNKQPPMHASGSGKIDADRTAESAKLPASAGSGPKTQKDFTEDNIHSAKKDLPYRNNSKPVEKKKRKKKAAKETAPNSMINEPDITYDLDDNPKVSSLHTHTEAASDEEEEPEIYLGFAQEPDIALPPIEAGSVFDDNDDFDDDLL